MTLPIQAPPIDRANRAINAAGGSRGISLQKVDLGDIIGVGCEACSFLPFPFSLICRTACKTVAGQL
jgi:hypothetical protein